MTSSGSGAWTEPGAFEVAPGVHRVPLPLPNDEILRLVPAQGRLSSTPVDGLEHYGVA